MNWNKPTDRPIPGEPIVILTDDGNVCRGEMRSQTFFNETAPTVSFHGRYYDFQQNKIVLCLVNALAWIPLPPLPRNSR